MINNIDYHIIDRCNLNCASCNHFSSLVPATDMGKSIEQITADLTLLSKIKDEFETLSLLGGEPTLHPQLSKILRIARQIFPDKEIHLVTNGTKYDKFDRWKDSLVENKIKVYISVYPYCEDYETRLNVIEDTLRPEVEVYNIINTEEHGFDYGFLTNREDGANKNGIYNCGRPFSCCQLKNGKVYICNFAAQFDVLKKFFGDRITFDLNGSEYFDLNGDITPELFNNFIYNAIPNICYHCVDVGNNYERTHEWGVTKKELNEWIID